MPEQPHSDMPMDLTDCDREPIRIPGSIQPHGILLALDSDLIVVQVAGNTEMLLGVSHAALLGQDLERHLGSANIARLAELLRNDPLQPHAALVCEMTLENSLPPLDAVVHISAGIVVVELEAQQKDPVRDPLALVQQMISRVTAAESVTNFCSALVEEVRQTTGFDRVMLYQFLADESGSVVAEARADDVDSYLGLRYPASDIPRQARDLYLTSWLRLIPDATYVPAPIEPTLNPRTGQPLDLSRSVLRSVSPIHLRYLANMGVTASLSISIVIKGVLWGLIACHHRRPRFLDSRRRAACELFAQMASLHLQGKITGELAQKQLRSREVHSALAAIFARDGLNEALTANRPKLLSLIEAQGCAVFVDGEMSSTGAVPPTVQKRALVRWLDTQPHDGVFATDSLASILPDATSYASVGSGVLALSISRVPKDYILWFRPEQVQIVRWAGNPEKPVQPGQRGSSLSPRASFAAWEQTVRLRSAPWSEDEIATARTMRNSILEIVLNRLDATIAEREQEKLRQDMLMAELDHRVKNTLAVIQSLVSFSSKSAASLTEFVGGLQDRLMAMARVQGMLTEARWEGVPLRTLVEEELAVFQAPGQSRCEISGDAIVLKPSAGMALSLALHELATNAGKYGAFSVPGGRVRVAWRLVQDKEEPQLVIGWAEEGGPPVPPPTRTGFGRTLLERVLGHDLRGTVDLRFGSTGVTCDITLSAEQIVKLPPSGVATRPDIIPPATAPAMAGWRVLLVEDQGLVAAVAQMILEEEEIVVVGPVGNVQDALRTIAEQKIAGQEIDAAILDVDLAGEPVWQVADALADSNVPFFFTTGYQASVMLPPRFIQRRVVAKPYRPAELIAALRDVGISAK